MSGTEVITRPTIKPNVDLEEPSLYRVIYVNDDETSMQFVVESLITIFSYDPDGAMSVTEEVHVNGSAVVAVYPFEIAEQKALEVTASAKANGFPLRVRVEEDA